jgi:arylsulfatase A-like enzyme
MWLAGWLLFVPAVIARGADRPNIILIIADDQAAGMAGFEGHPHSQTSNLDRLAREGAWFSHCYTPTPQGAPSQAAIISGCYPHATGVTANGDTPKPTLDPFTARLQRAGYACGLVGKWSLPAARAKEPGYGLTDYVATSEETGPWTNRKVWVNGEEGTADGYLTDWEGDRAIEFVERFQDEPFFLWLSFRTPHEPFETPPGLDDLYDPKELALPPTLDIDHARGRPATLNGQPAVQQLRQHRNQLREHQARYLAMISRLDENVGRLLDRLDALGLADETIVVFTSENGWCMGDHGLYGKGPFFYDELIRVPLVIRVPEGVEPGSRIERVVSLVDLAPTILDLAGLATPVTMHGESLLELLVDALHADHRDERFLEYEKEANRPMIAHGVIGMGYKFVDYAQGQDLLYDLERDPHETWNVASERAYQGVLKVMQARVDAWRRTTGDPTMR